jgi:5-methylcytosine-specific restriction endonuclease McrA
VTERRQFCPKGHDTFEVGRDSSYRCLVCKREAAAAARDVRRAEQEAVWRAGQAERNAELRRWNEQWRRRTEKLQRARELEDARARKAKKPEQERPQEPPSKPQPRRRRPPASPGHRWRSCIVNGCPNHFEIPAYARKSPSRCPEHRSGWDAKPKERDLAYADPTYRRLRAEILAPKPLCSYPGCQLVADTLDHIVPVSRGGQNTRENLRPMCRRHNEALGRAAGNETKRRRKS